MPNWVEFRKLSDPASAEALVELLIKQGVPARVAAAPALPGMAGDYSISVPSGLLHRARWIAPEWPYDDAELAYLATGDLGSE
jgi:hypothetical protein